MKGKVISCTFTFIWTVRMSGDPFLKCSLNICLTSSNSSIPIFLKLLFFAVTTREQLCMERNMSSS